MLKNLIALLLFICLVIYQSQLHNQLHSQTREKTIVNQANIQYAIENSIELIHPTNASDINHAIIWLHGLGATANDFPPIVPHLGLASDTAIRFIFPQAPNRPITINNGFVMPGWYDIKGLDLAAKEDREGLEESQAIVEQLIAREIERGVPASNIILAGFSQGGAVTYYTGVRSQHQLAGMLTLSTYWRSALGLIRFSPSKSHKQIILSSKRIASYPHSAKTSR